MVLLCTKYLLLLQSVCASCTGHAHDYKEPTILRKHRKTILSNSSDTLSLVQVFQAKIHKKRKPSTLKENITSGAERFALQASKEFPLDLNSLVQNVDDVGLSVTGSFYVYDELDWLSMTCGDLPVEEALFDEMPISKFKHSDDYWFMKAALSHPLRVKDPAKAQMFVVPALLNAVGERMFERGVGLTSGIQCCLQGMCDRSLFDYTDRMLANSSWFHRFGGKDHVIVCSHFSCGGLASKFEHIQQMNWITFEENSMRGGRCRIAGLYVGNRCEKKEEKKDEVVFVGNMARAQRRIVCEWVRNTSFKVSTCGRGEHCPAVAQSRFGLHIGGDTLGSNRLMDYILSGTVPIFFDERQYQILPSFVPWRDVSALIDSSSEQGFQDSLNEIVPRYDTLKKAVDMHAKLVDWETPAPFEQYMQLFQRCRHEPIAIGQ